MYSLTIAQQNSSVVGIKEVDMKKESAAINKEYEEMLARLCNIKEAWCLPKAKAQNNIDK